MTREYYKGQDKVEAKTPVRVTANSDLLCCPFCYSGIIFNTTYGSERQCNECKGKGEITREKLVKLGLT